MIAKIKRPPIISQPATEEFRTLADAINRKLTEAAFANTVNEGLDYFLSSKRAGIEHAVAVICVASSFEPLARRKTEQLRIAVPVERPDSVMPETVLGLNSIESENLFELTYIAKRGGLKAALINPEVYARRYMDKPGAPVTDLLGKISTFQVIPMRGPDRESDLTDF